MTEKRKIEIFSAGCVFCEETVNLIKSMACDSCDVEVLDLNDEDVVERARNYGIKRFPAVVIDGNPKILCPGCENDEKALREAGVGVPKE